MGWRERGWQALVATMAVFATGCPAPLPPVSAFATVGAANGDPRSDLERETETEPDENRSTFAYSARLGMNPQGYSSNYANDPTIDFSLGYGFEHYPLLEGFRFLHAPYMEVSYWPDLKPLTYSRVGARAFGELLAYPRRGDPVNGLSSEMIYGAGATIAVAWEETIGLRPGLWEREKTPSTFGYGRSAFGFYALTSYRNVGDARYFFVGIGASIRVPVSVSDLTSE